MNTPERPVIAIVGRPNVGKSTLFNRLSGKRRALVDDTPGVTRDRRLGRARLADLSFDIIDTAGLEQARRESLGGRMSAQTARAIEEADCILFVVDGRAGVTPVDAHFARALRRAAKPVIVIANKLEGHQQDWRSYDVFALGLGDPVALSAEHGEGMVHLYQALRPLLEGVPENSGQEPCDANPGPDKALSIAIVGRPNAGKSSLINRLIGDDRLITGSAPGITRDSIAIDWQWRGRAVRLHDTAGMRRRARVRDKLERLSVADALRAIRFAHVVVLVIDIQSPLDKQDIQIANLVEREGRALVLALNKWDLAPDADLAARLSAAVEAALPHLRGVPAVAVSALQGTGLDRLMDAIIDAQRIWNMRVPTGALNRWFSHVSARHTPPALKGKPLRLRYITQTKARPPTFVLFCSRPGDVPDAYRRYLVNGLRETFSFAGVPIRLILRKGKNPYV